MAKLVNCRLWSGDLISSAQKSELCCGQMRYYSCPRPNLSLKEGLELLVISRKHTVQLDVAATKRKKKKTTIKVRI